MRLKISHQTRYRYDAPVRYGLQQLRLTPKSRAGQEVVNWQTSVAGGSIELAFDDEHNNHVELVSIDPDQLEVTVNSVGEVETTDTAGIIGVHGGFAPLWLFNRNTPLTQAERGVGALVGSLPKDYTDDVARLHELAARIAAMVAYETGQTHSATTAEDALAAGHGVCQDHAHIFISAARLMGYPARYVSGYLMMDDRVEQDATHAWAEAHIIGLGWVGFDVSNGVSPDARYVRVATGLDYQQASPISGLRIGAGGEAMHVAVQVQQ